jgi:hypothetical protein
MAVAEAVVEIAAAAACRGDDKLVVEPYDDVR